MRDIFPNRKKRGPVMVAILLTSVALAGLTASFIETPQSQNEFLHEHLEAVTAINDVTWKSAGFDLPRQDKTDIAKIITQAEYSNSKSDLKNTLTGQALEQARARHCTTKQAGCIFTTRVNRVLMAKHINKDLRVANITEQSRRLDFEVTSDGTDIRLTGLSNESRVLRFYQTQAGWIHNMSETSQTNAPSFSEREGKFRQRFEKDFTGLNYYPASASWTDFWAEFPLEEIKTDLEVAKTLNVNSLRIFLTHDYFDRAKTREDGLSKLDIFLDLCAAKDIEVIVTLFDLRPNYTLSNWSADIEHIDAILSRIADHKAILAIDIKNQPDLDFGYWGRGLIEGWLTVMARHIQTDYPQLPVTAGWSDAKEAHRLKNIFDLVTYHEYENPNGFEARLQSVVDAAQGKPVMITELGSTTWNLPFIARIGEAAQAKRLQKQLGQSHQSNGVFVWTLNDFNHVGREVVGPLPWRRAQQQHFGLMRNDGTPRPAAKILKSFGQRAQTQAKLTPLTPVQNTPL